MRGERWIDTLRARILLGITLAPVAFAVVALPWGLIKVAGAPDPDRETTGTIVDTDERARSTCVTVVEFTVDGRSYRASSVAEQRYACAAARGSEEVVHYESADPDAAYAGDVSPREQGARRVRAGLAALALATLPGLLALVDLAVFRARARAPRRG